MLAAEPPFSLLGSSSAWKNLKDRFGTANLPNMGEMRQEMSRPVLFMTVNA